MDKKLFEYFTTDNISGKKCNEKWLIKNNKLLYDEIINWTKINKLENLEFKTKVYHYVYKKIDFPLCSNCNKKLKYFNFKKGYGKYCGDKCMKSSIEYKEKWKNTWKLNNENNEHITKREKTIIEKYKSIENYKKIINDNKKSSLNKKYGNGIENVFQLDYVKNQRKKTLKEKYGDEKFNNKDKTREIRIKNGTQIDDTKTELFENYKKIVTNRTLTIYRNNINEINPLNLKRGKINYHIDHLFSIKQGFLNNISIEIITHPCNLYMIWYKDNIEKQDRCDITIENLIEKIGKYNNDVIIKQSKLNELYKKENILKNY